MSLHQIYRLEFMTNGDITKEEFEAIITQSILEYEMKMNENGRIRCHVHESFDAEAELAKARDDLSRLRYPDTTGQ